MKILIVTPVYPPEIGGPATYSALVARELRRRGNSVEIIALSDDAVAMDDTTTHFLPKKGSKTLRQARLTALIARKARRFDVVFGLDIAVVGLAAVMASKLVRKPCVIRYVGDVAWERSARDGLTSKNLEEFLANPDASRKVLWLQRRVFRNADAIVACSNFLKQVAEKYYKLDSGRVFSIYNALESAVPDKAESGRQLGLGNAFVTVCRLVPWKRVDRVIKAMSLLAAKHPDAKLVVVGDGPEMENLRATARQQGVENAVEFVGRKPNEEALRYISAGKGFVLNSGYEGMAFVILEAMACRTPIICSDIPQNREIVSDNETGFLVRSSGEAENMGDLAQKMSLVLEHPEAAARVADNARNYLNEKHSLESHASQLEKVFTAVAKRV